LSDRSYFYGLLRFRFRNFSRFHGFYLWLLNRRMLLDRFRLLYGFRLLNRLLNRYGLDNRLNRLFFLLLFHFMILRRYGFRFHMTLLLLPLILLLLTHLHDLADHLFFLLLQPLLRILLGLGFGNGAG